MRRARALLACLLFAHPAAAAQQDIWTRLPDPERIQSNRAYKSPRNALGLDDLTNANRNVRIGRPRMIDSPDIVRAPDRIRRPQAIRTDTPILTQDRIARPRRVDTSPQTYSYMPERVSMPSRLGTNQPYARTGFRPSREQRIEASGLTTAAGLARETGGVKPGVGLISDPDYSPNSIRTVHEFKSIDREMSRQRDRSPGSRQQQFTGDTVSTRRDNAAFAALKRGARADRVKNPSFQGSQYQPDAPTPKSRERAMPRIDRSNREAAYTELGDAEFFRKGKVPKADKAPVAPLFTIR